MSQTVELVLHRRNVVLELVAAVCVLLILEMGSIVFFLHAVLEYIAQSLGSVRLLVGAADR